MYAFTAESAANNANRARLKEILEKIDTLASAGKYNAVMYITPHHTDQTIFVREQLNELGFMTIGSLYKHKLFVSWEPEKKKHTPIWYLHRFAHLTQLIW